MNPTDGGPGEASDRRVAEPGSPPEGANGPGWPRWGRQAVAWMPLVALAAYLVPAVHTGGVSVGAAVRAFLAIALTQVVPGALLWRMLRRGPGTWFEDLTVGAGIGIALAVAAQTVAGLAGLPAIARFAGPALAAVLLVVPAARARIVSAEVRPVAPYVGPGVAAASMLLLPMAINFHRGVPAAWADGFRSLYVDMPFHLALTGELAHRGPLEIPFVLGESLRYHWFSHAWTAQIGLAGDVELASVLFGIVPGVSTILALCAIGVAATRIARHDAVGPVAVLLAVALGNVDLTGSARPTSVISHRSPSLSVSAAVLFTLVTVLVMHWRGQTSKHVPWLMFALALAAAGSKGSAIAVAVAGVALALVLVWRRAPERGRVAMALLVVGGAMLASMLLVFGGGDRGLALEPLEAMRRSGASSILFDATSWSAVAAGLGVLVFFAEVLARAVGAAPLASRREVRADPAIALLVGMGLAGVLGIALLTHPGNSQAYFHRNGAPALAIVSAIGVVALLRAYPARLLTGRILAAGFVVGGCAIALSSGVAATTPRAVLLAAAGVAGVVVLGALSGAWLLGRQVHIESAVPALSLGIGIVAALVVAGGPVVHQYVFAAASHATGDVGSDARRAFSADQVEAARWLRDHSRPEDVVATNRHCGVQQWARCDSRRFYVAAYTERRVLVEGWAYTRSWAMTEPVEGYDEAYKPFWDPDRLELNDDFLQVPTRAAAEALRAAGVRWLFLDKTAPFSDGLDEFANHRFETEWAIVMELQGSS